MTVYSAILTDGVNILDLQTAKASPSNEGYLVSDPERLINPGAVTWKRQQVSSPFIDGPVTVHSTLDGATLEAEILVLWSNPTSMQAALTTLINFIKKPVFYAWVILDGTVTYIWQCEKADYGVAMNRRTVHGNSAVVRISAPRRPIPITGPI